tara:strand:- start:171 stop:1616 length:1446 start_codon:yes stop_codon:yes gene_type:complete
MKSVFNQSTLLWVIGILQPVSAPELAKYLKLVLDSAGHLPDEDKLHKLIMRQEQAKRVIRVARNPDLFSMTSLGNAYLTKEERHSRDKARLYLLKDARKARMYSSREVPDTGLGGVAPSVNARPLTKEREVNIIGPVVPSGQLYWPRFSKQLNAETGLSQASRDVSLLSYNTPQQLSIAIGEDIADLTLDYNAIGMMLGISPRLVVGLTRRPERHYRSFELPKKGGGIRTIESPRVFLKVVQQFLADYYLSGLPVHASVHSYKKNASIISNATNHSGKEFVGNIDIENFFGSIHKSRVVQLLRENAYDAISSGIISSLCCSDGTLPQGATTSPAISNAILIAFDQAMHEKSTARGVTYTRYADDISLSGQDKDAILELINYARGYLHDEYGLRLNSDKTRIASKHGQQKVTGVVVNEGLRPPRKFRRQIRASFHKVKCSNAVHEDTIKRLKGYYSYLSGFSSLKGTQELQAYRLILDQLKQ